LSVTCDRTVVFSGSSGFLHQSNLPPRCPHNWNIVESGVKHHQTNMFVNKKVHLRSVFGYMYMYLKMDSCVGHFKSRHFEYYIICAQQGGKSNMRASCDVEMIRIAIFLWKLGNYWYFEKMELKSIAQNSWKWQNGSTKWLSSGFYAPSNSC
jgi:hypothetical protein